MSDNHRAPSQLSILRFVSTTPGGGHPSRNGDDVVSQTHRQQVTWTSRTLTSRRVVSLCCLKPFAGEYKPL